MNKWFNIVVLVTMVILAGCAKVETVDTPEKIFFAVGKYATEKTRSESYLDYENRKVFRSKAFLHTEGAAAGSVFFESNIRWDGTTWAPEHDYYWPKHPDSYLNFVSWYASEGITPTTVSETSFILTREIAAADSILVADEAWRCRSNTATYNFNSVTAGVPTLFHHVLCRVKINMNATLTVDPDNANNTYEVILQDAALKGVYRRGTLNLTNSDSGTTRTKAWNGTNTTYTTYLWIPTNGTNNTDFDLVDSNTTLTTENVVILQERSFMPQKVEGLTLELLYTITAKSNGVTTNSECDIPATVVLNTIKNTSNMEITQWLPNMKYTYNISINPISGEILLNPTVETDWADGMHINATVE